ncbi:GldM family protein [uncultured Winogradskyella sp.]|uniref:GldM family protein n=1 Tax=uncultured Winogradskyella sp. TaxID=395353 RepID=UPI00262C46EC|nr:GldM family protein [uncultured Winogradskyella sp.]
MKNLSVFIIVSFSFLLSCKSSICKTQLLSENNTLKKRIQELETKDSINFEAAIELKKMNVVYRGVTNPIYITIPHALSFEASAPGLKKNDSIGNYIMYPGSGTTVDILIKATLKNGKEFTQIKTLRIRDIGNIEGTLNSIQCGNSKCQLLFTKEELKNSKIGLNGDNFVFNLDLDVTGFKLKLPNIETIQVNGNTIPETINDELDKLKPDDKIVIFDINLKVNNPNFSTIRICKTPIIQVRIIE